jgi:hypothetical protein
MPVTDRERPWFVSRRRGYSYNLKPARIEGWLLTIGYCVLVTAIAAGGMARQPGYWPVWATMVAALTLMFVLTAARNSRPADRKDR